MNTDNWMVAMATLSAAEKMDLMLMEPMMNGDTMGNMMNQEMMEMKMPVMEPGEITERFATALNGNDLAGIMQLFDAEGATVPHPGAPAVAGMDSVQGVMTQCLALQPHISYDDTQVIVADDIALLRSTWRLQVTGPDGNRVEMMGKGMQVARQQMDGSWSILIDNPWCAE
jgi:uncharacterized protein (TIGR02246 family)